MTRKLFTPGNLAMVALVWVPLWAIGGLIIGGHAAIMAGLYIAALPLLIGVIILWALAVIRIDSLPGFAVAVVLGVPLVLWLAGLNFGLMAIGASVMLWCISRIVSRRSVVSRA